MEEEAASGATDVLQCNDIMFVCVDSYCTIYWKKKGESVNENEVWDTCVSSRILFVIFVKVRIQIIINIYPYIHIMINERGYRRRKKTISRNSADRMNDTVRIYDTKKKIEYVYHGLIYRIIGTNNRVPNFLIIWLTNV